MNKQKKNEERIHVIDGPEDMVYDCDVCGYIGYSGGARLDLANGNIIHICGDCCRAIELRWGKDSCSRKGGWHDCGKGLMNNVVDYPPKEPSGLDCMGTMHGYVPDISATEASICPFCSKAIGVACVANHFGDLRIEGFCRTCLRTVLIHQRVKD